MIYYFFLLLFLLLSFVGSKSAKASCFLVFIFTIAFMITDSVMLHYNYRYIDHVFIALCFCFMLVYSLVNFVNGSASNRQAIVLIGAMITHVLMLVDLVAGTSMVYDNYENLLLFITVIQMAVSNDKFINAIAGSFERVLLLLCRRVVFGESNARFAQETKNGAFRA